MFATELNRSLAWLIRRAAVHLYAARWQELQAEIDHAVALLPKLDLGKLPIALIVAEDRRFLQHAGFDVLGMLRAAAAFTVYRKLQGASTITQQLVRTMTRDYEVTLARKLREISLSTLVDRRYSKREQIELYLKIAYFGWRMNGVYEAMRQLNLSFPADEQTASEVIARLRYPQPRVPGHQRTVRIARRAAYIRKQIEETHIELVQTQEV